MMLSPADILSAQILIVDDQEANVQLLVQLLQEAGYQNLTTTRDPYAVCELHRSQHFDLILLDLQMPGMDGFAVMAALKQTEGQGYAPVLAITVQPRHKLRALASGAKDFISKPFDIEELKTRIHNMLEVRLLYNQLEHNNLTLEALALHDALTQLPNRRLLLDRLRQAQLSSARTHRHCALLFMDIDHFKQLNDTLGHIAGDELLQQVSKRILGCAREGDTVARFGGDEFVVLLESLSASGTLAEGQVKVIADKMHHALRQTYQLLGQTYDTSLSIGVAIFSGDAQAMSSLLKKADQAMYQAKADDTQGVCFDASGISTK
ncbi:diguanylate cyclase [Rhodoferax sp.]|uniref:diguanylate cyclase domain-containing protein n=1 Tax=Rhodoferax sp. TaxID=50421 RepID=UPI00261D1A8A|nr:diguanylate cyclase [Rhodoferax sp.]MDD5479452.1 diguanylate cyclase [Rhodoferax sp.]